MISPLAPRKLSTWIYVSRNTDLHFFDKPPCWAEILDKALKTPYSLNLKAKAPKAKAPKPLEPEP